MSAASEPFEFDMSRRRVLTASTKPVKDGNCVIYWMSRDQRAEVRAVLNVQDVHEGAVGRSPSLSL